MHMYNMTEACCNINVVRQQLVSVGESRGCSMMEGVFIMIHCLVSRTDVPGFQYTPLVVVWMGLNHFCFFPINLMYLVNYMVCTPDWAVFLDVNAFLCSFKQCSMVLPVWLMCTLEHEPHPSDGLR